MSRINVGLNPKLLSDQHLVAESVEITMITGGLRSHNYQIKGDVPEHYPLGKGHINFFKNKLVYLNNRLIEVNNEMRQRGFKPGTHIDLQEFPAELRNDWKPTLKDTLLLRARVVDRLMYPKSGKVGHEYHRYYGQVLGAKLLDHCSVILTSEVHFV